MLTPGLLGLTGLFIARILKLPVDSTYQNALPAHVRSITKDESMEHLFRRYSTWFYNQKDSVYANSSKIAMKMVREGILSEKIKIVETHQDRKDGRVPEGDSFLKARFHLPRNWRIYDRVSALKVAN